MRNFSNLRGYCRRKIWWCSKVQIKYCGNEGKRLEKEHSYLTEKNITDLRNMNTTLLHVPKEMIDEQVFPTFIKYIYAFIYLPLYCIAHRNVVEYTVLLPQCTLFRPICLGNFFLSDNNILRKLQNSFKGTVRRDGSGCKWSHWIDLY